MFSTKLDYFTAELQVKQVIVKWKFINLILLFQRSHRKGHPHKISHSRVVSGRKCAVYLQLCFLSLLLLRKHFNAFTDEQVYIPPKKLSASLSCLQPTVSNYSFMKCIQARSIPRSVMGLSDLSDWLVWTSSQSTPDSFLTYLTYSRVLPSSHESSCIWNLHHQVNQKITSDHLPVF